ncbi:DUF5977 domain-containing protein [Mucilaginibacter sp. UR6-1]|uniref:DUF5977 domain-containing protein n=1 Tax=Mucilaginibacter sp. UR6-1 TaxID=1435643 RepID=UPI001E6446C3|nr:DUF5977 domain-containing protein [Mucilaginibacter sp. UR6-1]MCC8409078.1 DUF5977 domain-containing protein [Mucilaginibacter sp. UR6-1]
MQSIIAFAQSSNNYTFQNMIPVSTVAPNAAALGKFGNIPVSYATGIPSISIPLYEINAGKVRIPLSLDYHSGGVRVDEVASSVGTSWALSGLPTISRNMIGVPDEDGTGYLYALPLDSIYNFMSGESYGTQKDLVYAQFIRNIRDKVTDTEPDVFSYNLIGSSGKFIYRPNGSIMQIPQTNNKIERVGSGFRITDESGNSYIFDKTESTNIVTQSAVNWSNYTSTWRVSKIIDQSQSDTVSFSYEAIIGNTERSWSFTHSIGSRPEMPCGINDQIISEPSSSVSSVYHSELNPKEISWNNGKVLFKNVTDRIDRTSNARLDSVKIYSLSALGSQLIKQAKLHQSYFYSNPISGRAANDYRNYRLRLDSVRFIPVSGQNRPYRYKMVYKTIDMAPNESYAQDRWGYNNGQFNNQSLMPTQTVLFFNSYETFGNANTNPNESYMQACMLESIEYPTMGKSVFEFEPHSFLVDYQEMQLQNHGINANGGVQSQNSMLFTVDSTQSAFRYSVYISPYAGANVADRPRVELYDQTANNTLIFSVTNTNTVNNPSLPTNVTDRALNLIVGHTYKFIVNIYTSTSPGVNANGVISWLRPVSGTVARHEGGLRIKSITNYDNNGLFTNKQAYTYGANGIGSLITAASFLQQNYEDIVFANTFETNCGNNTGYGSIIVNSAPARIYHQKGVYPATQISGSPVVYKAVTKYDYNESGIPNGKAEFEYDIYEDQNLFEGWVFRKNIGVWMISDAWKNGFVKREKTYRFINGVFTPVIKKGFVYITHRPETHQVLKIKPIFVKMSSMEILNVADTKISSNRFYANYIPTNTGAMLLLSESDTTYDDSGNEQITIRNNTYGNGLHNNPTQVQTTNSQSENIVQELKYAHDYTSAGNVYQKMLNRNIVSPVITSKETNNGIQISYSKINYKDWYNDSKVLMPETAEMQVGSNSIETKISFNSFDRYGNILEQAKAQGPPQSYRWGYKSQYPVAEIKNAAYKDTWYEGFEEPGGTSTLNDAQAGHYSKTGGYTKSLSGLKNGTYVLSYWRKSSGKWLAEVNDNITVSNGTYNISIASTTQVDEVRFYPKDALMSTFTYDPQIGMTSGTDAKNQTSYYEYDGFQRLLNVKDEEKNVIKNYAYNYGPGSLPVTSLVGNQVQSQTFNKQGCGTGYTGSAVTYTVGANSYYAGTQAEANQLALNDIATNGQSYANTNGACNAIPANPYIKLEIKSSYLGSDNHYYAVYSFKAFSDAAMTVPMTVSSNYPVPYKQTSTTTYSNGSTPTTSVLNKTTSILSGTSYRDLTVDVNTCGQAALPSMVANTATTEAATATQTQQTDSAQATGTTTQATEQSTQGATTQSAEGTATTNTVPPGGGTPTSCTNTDISLAPVLNPE